MGFYHHFQAATIFANLIFTKLYIYFLTKSGFYPPNFGYVSSITVKIRQFQVFSLMCSLIVYV